VDVLNGPMMSFSWFEQQRALFDHTCFPGTFLTKRVSQPHGQGAFALEDLLLVHAHFPAGAACTNASLGAWAHERIVSRSAERPFADQFVPRNVAGGARAAWNGGVFYAGEPMFPVSDMEWVTVPFGLSSAVLPADADVSAWVDRSAAAWALVQETFRPPRWAEYADDTWEWTTGEDTWKNAESHAAFALEQALARDPIPLQPVLDAIRLLEGALARAHVAGRKPKTAVLKNLGLAYARLIQRKVPLPDKQPELLPAIPGDDSSVGAELGGADAPLAGWTPPNGRDAADWSGRAAKRVVELWTAFLERPDAQEDASYSAILATIQALHRAVHKPK
jgi:hypothetical protein